VDEAWKTGTLLAEGVIRLLNEGRPFTGQNLQEVYVEPRRKSWLGVGARKAQGCRDGFQKGFIPGLLGTALAGLSGGRLRIASEVKSNFEKISEPEDYFKGRISSDQLQQIRTSSNAAGTNMYEAVMDKTGWPKIEYDGKLFISHQDALLLGGKVQAPAGYADHVVFLDTGICADCSRKLCIEMCSGQAITPGDNGIPQFDREKCIHCGACFWNCTRPRKGDSERSNLDFRAGTGGLHSADN
jgi:electron-transferring-flavoprotein dehydrogenase